MATFKILNSQKFAENGQLINVLHSSGDAETLNSPREKINKFLNPEFKENKLDGRKTFGYANGKYIPKFISQTEKLELTRCEETFGKGAIAVFVSWDDDGIEPMLDGDSAIDEAYAEYDAKGGDNE